jgi:hypothetical protein
MFECKCTPYGFFLFLQARQINTKRGDNRLKILTNKLDYNLLLHLNSHTLKCHFVFIFNQMFNKLLRILKNKKKGFTNFNLMTFQINLT